MGSLNKLLRQFQPLVGSNRGRFADPQVTRLIETLKGHATSLPKQPAGVEILTIPAHKPNQDAAAVWEIPGTNLPTTLLVVMDGISQLAKGQTSRSDLFVQAMLSELQTAIAASKSNEICNSLVNAANRFGSKQGVISGQACIVDALQKLLAKVRENNKPDDSWAGIGYTAFVFFTKLENGIGVGIVEIGYSDDSGNVVVFTPGNRHRLAPAFCTSEYRGLDGRIATTEKHTSSTGTPFTYFASGTNPEIRPRGVHIQDPHHQIMPETTRVSSRAYHLVVPEDAVVMSSTDGVDVPRGTTRSDDDRTLAIVQLEQLFSDEEVEI